MHKYIRSICTSTSPDHPMESGWVAASNIVAAMKKMLAGAAAAPPPPASGGPGAGAIMDANLICTNRTAVKKAAARGKY